MALALELGGSEDIEAMSDGELEKAVVNAYAKATKKNIYDDDRHREDVIDYIVNRCGAKFRVKANPGQAYEGLLTVDSIQNAQHYYKLIKDFVAKGKVAEEIRRYLPDFPKIAITYTVGENEDGAKVNQSEMLKSLADYNAMFGTSWDLSSIGAYNAELNERLARKRSKYHNRDQQLDLVIVVDRLLTGFDAPCLATIFLDRPPMKPHHLIQAFSRTNRLFDTTKRFGNVITLQTPELYGEKIDEALKLYSNGGTADVQAPFWEETSENLKKAVSSLRLVAKTPKDGDEILNSGSLPELQAFAKAYQRLDRMLAEIQVYDEFERDQLRSVFDITMDEFEQYKGRYQNIIARIREIADDDDGQEPISIDVDYELESIRQVEVNYRYLVALLQAHMPEANDLAKAVSDSEDKRISKYIEDYTKVNPKVGGVLRDIWFELKLNPESFRNRDAFEVIDERVNERLDKEIGEFSARWGINPDELAAYANSTPASEISPQTINQNIGDYNAYKACGGTLTKLQYCRRLREAVSSFVRQDIKPFQRR